MVVAGPGFSTVDRVFEFDFFDEFDFFEAFEAVACTGVLTSCDDVKGAVAAGSRSLGMTGFVEVVFEPDFALRAIL